MEVLDEANTGTYGHPEPTPVPDHPGKGQGHTGSGHDLKDLEEILKQTEGKDINVYTTGRCFPVTDTPALRSLPILQATTVAPGRTSREEFEKFPGPF